MVSSIFQVRQKYGFVGGMKLKSRAIADPASMDKDEF
jgi:hypothetical protein